MKYTSREGLAAYGYEDIFKVPSVILVTALVDNRSKQREKEEQKQRPKAGTFEEVFRETRKAKIPEEEFACQMMGYTKDAKGYTFHTVMQREYV